MINIDFGDRHVDVHLKGRQIRIKHYFITGKISSFGVVQLTKEFLTGPENLVLYLDKTSTERLLCTLNQLLAEFKENEEQT